MNRIQQLEQELATAILERDEARVALAAATGIFDQITKNLIAERDTTRDMFIDLPIELILYNGGQQCDMIFGPCACGAFHSIKDIKDRLSKLSSKSKRNLPVIHSTDSIIKQEDIDE